MQAQPMSTITAEDDGQDYFIPKPADWFTKLVSLQADLIHDTMAALVSPFVSFLTMASQSYHRAEEAKDRVESVVQQAPSRVTHGSSLLLKRLGLGFLGAAYVCMVLFVVMVLAVAVGVSLVQFWVEEPVVVRERLHFDYTELNPKAVFLLNGGGFEEYYNSRKHLGIPVGHTFTVSLMLLMPESDFNRDIGVFQLTAELLSADGDIIEKSSQPCMLRFRSSPVRLARTFIMGVPLLLGLSAETQKITVHMLNHKEGHPRTEAIRVTMIPRARTFAVPQIYEAEIIVNSQLPWIKHLVHNWKWTFYVWTSLYIYVMFLIILVWFFRPLIFPVALVSLSDSTERLSRDISAAEPIQPRSRTEDDSEISELLRKWRSHRGKRKAVALEGETFDSAASSITLTREDTSAATAEGAATAEEDTGDSESVYLRG